MDLRKNLPVQNDVTSTSDGSMIFKVLTGITVFFMGGFFLLILLVSLFSSPSQSQNISQPQKKVAEVVNQSNSKLWQNASDVLSQGNNKLRKNASNVIAQRNKPQRPSPQSSKPPQSAPKPVAQAKPTAPRPTNVASSAGKTTGLISKAIKVGKVGLFIISKGKVKLR